MSGPATDLTGERLFFRCGHERTADNMQPNGMQRGKPKVRCRACYNERERVRWSTNTARREAALTRKREQRAQARKPRIAMRDRIAQLEQENELLKHELNLTLDALVAARAAVKRAKPRPSPHKD